MSGNKQRRFTDKFKREAVRLTMTTDATITIPHWIMPYWLRVFRPFEICP